MSIGPKNPQPLHNVPLNRRNLSVHSALSLFEPRQLPTGAFQFQQEALPLAPGLAQPHPRGPAEAGRAPGLQRGGPKRCVCNCQSVGHALRALGRPFQAGRLRVPGCAEQQAQLPAVGARLADTVGKYDCQASHERGCGGPLACIFVQCVGFWRIVAGTRIREMMVPCCARLCSVC